MGFSRQDALSLARSTGNLRLATAMATSGNAVPAEHPNIIGVIFRIDGLRLKNTLNAWEPWFLRSKREREEKHRVFFKLVGIRPSVLPPCVVTITREYSRRCKEMDTDGLSASAKVVRDQIAAWLGCDDSPRSPITWVYEQRRAEMNAVVVTVEAAPAKGTP